MNTVLMSFYLFIYFLFLFFISPFATQAGLTFRGAQVLEHARLFKNSSRVSVSCSCAEDFRALTFANALISLITHYNDKIVLMHATFLLQVRLVFIQELCVFKYIGNKVVFEHATFFALK